VTGHSWGVIALALMLGTAIVWAVLNERAQHRRKRQLAEIRRSRQATAGSATERHSAVHNLAEVELHTLRLYPGIPDTHLITDCPMVATADGPMPLRDWLRRFAGADAWPTVVERFYTRAAADPAIAAFFRGVDMMTLQRHFLAALMIVTGQGVTVGLVRRMHAAHAGVRNSKDEPITPAVWDTVIGVLAAVLGELDTPPATLTALGATIAPIRAAVVEPTPTTR
jgi:truncated hemoglobin YjbI